MARISTLLSTIAWVALASAVPAAELRTTVGDRTVYRQVAFEKEIAAPSEVEVATAGWEHEIYEPAVDCVGCSDNGCSQCVPACGRWASFEYLLWWRRGGSLPPLVTTSPQGTALNQAGVLGLGTTTVLFGDQTYGADATAGGRFTIGKWLDDCECFALEGRFFALGRQTTSFDISSNGTPILARPFNNRDAMLGPIGPTSRPIAFPAIANNGRIFVRGESDVYGADVALRRRLCETGCLRFDLLLGYQYSRIEDDLTIGDSFVNINPNDLVVDGTRQDITDRFEAENDFNGGVIGLDASYYGSCWRLDLLARVALGSMRQMVAIRGQTVNDVPNDPNSPFVLQEGLLAGLSNQGVRERNEFAVVPEFGATMVFDLSNCVELSVGYSFIYWSNVVQAGHQIHRDLFVPSTFAFNENSYWVHGLNTGIEFRF